MRRLLFLAAVAAVLLALPTGAGAEVPTGASAVAPGEVKDITHEWLVKRDLHAAVLYWHRTANCLSYTIETGPTPFLAETALFGCSQRWNTEIWAYFASALDQSPNAKPLWTGDNPQQRRTEYLRWSCTLTIHEYGHSLGLPDQSSQPQGIMYQFSSPHQPTPPSICLRFFR